MAARKVTSNPFVGLWRIVEMEQWDQAFIDLEGPGYIKFNKRGDGEFRFGAVRGDMDCRLVSDPDHASVQFSWMGNDETDSVAGRGLAAIRNGELFGHLYFHRGMDSSFRAIPRSRSNSAMDSDTVRSPLRAPHGARHRGR
jgi:hypothetical protein